MARKTPPDVEVRFAGHCVYCENEGSAEKLSDEHVIPLAFGGYRYFSQAVSFIQPRPGAELLC